MNRINLYGFVLGVGLSLGLGLGVNPAVAAPHDVCVNRGFGVPTRSGPPAWVPWVNASPDVNPALDDPRWNNATTRAFVTGGATTPMHMRSVWSTDSTGQEWLYLSLVSDLNPNSTTPRDVFLGFRRAHSSPSVDSGSVGYIFQFHLAAGGAGAATTPAYCGDYGTPACLNADSWRVFRDPDLAPDPLKKCTNTLGVDITGHQYVQFNGGSTTTAPFSWKASGADSDFVQYWREGASRWAVQLRIKIAPNNAASPPPISAGIEKGSTFWYELTESVTHQYFGIGKFPDAVVDPGFTGTTKSVCVSPAFLNDSLFHEELGSIDPACPGPGCACPDCNPNKFAKLTDLGPDPGDCDAGLKITNVGALFNNSGPYNLATPLNDIKAVDSTNTVRANTMIAQLINTSAAPITAPVQARFRLANWGSGPIGSDQGQFSDIRGGAAVCLPTGSPACTPQMINPGVANQVAIHFDWTLGNDATLGASEYCAYQLAPPTGPGCAPCTCDGSQPGCPNGTSGMGVPGRPCVQVHNQHECMLVELSSTNSNVNFVQSSVYNNMNFAQMSTVAREALIDARKLPTVPGQAFQDVYFFVIPRNMPATVPAGTTTTALIQEAAIARAAAVAAPYTADMDRLSRDNPDLLKKIIEDLARQRPGQIQIGARSDAVVREGDKRIIGARRAALVMPNEDWLRVGNLVGIAGNQGSGSTPNDDLVHNAVSSLGPEEAAQVVPTLEIYPFYRPAKAVVYQPMTSFALFLSHEATLGGMRYEIDGATKVADNVYRVQIPVGYARKIQVRAQALAGNEALLGPPNPAWPCPGGCAGCGGGATRSCGLVTMVGNTMPGIIAGVFVVGRRKRRKPAAK